MNQILQEEHRRYLNGVGTIGRTHDILNQLEHKMAGYHERKRTEEQLLESRQEPPPQPKTKNTFKLFTKRQTKINSQNMHLQELEESNKRQNKGEVEQLLQEVEAIEQLVRKKLSLKEERVAQLQREIQLAGEEKLHLFKINSTLEQQLASLQKEKQQIQKKAKAEENDLQAELRTLNQIYQNKRNQNKRLRKDEQLLKDTLKQSQLGRKNYHQSEIKVFRNHSRSKISHKPTEPLEEEKYLRQLVGELDKLRKMVKQKMKKSTNKRKAR